MKKRYATIFTITVAAVLVSSIAYAAKKKLRTKSDPPTTNLSERDLAADLLDAQGDHKHSLTKVRETIRRGDEELKELTMASKARGERP